MGHGRAAAVVAAKKNIVRKTTDNLQGLPGCGGATLAKLNLAHVYTLQDLIDFTGIIQGVNIEKLQTTAKELTNYKKEISCHNWLGENVHILRSKGQVTRVVIGSLIFDAHRMLLSVTWRQNGSTRRTNVSPCMILATQWLWQAGDLVSDDSDDESVSPVASSLPPFAIDAQHSDAKKLSKSETYALRGLVKEILLFSSGVHRQAEDLQEEDEDQDGGSFLTTPEAHSP